MRNFFLLYVVFIMSMGVAVASPRTPEMYRAYSKQQYYNVQTKQIETPLFNSYAERNKHVSEKFVCIQPNPSEHGSVYVIYTSGRATRQYQPDFYNSVEPIKCDKRYDQYPNFINIKEAKLYYGIGIQKVK